MKIKVMTLLSIVLLFTSFASKGENNTEKCYEPKLVMYKSDFVDVILDETCKLAHVEFRNLDATSEYSCKATYGNFVTAFILEYGEVKRRNFIRYTKDDTLDYKCNTYNKKEVINPLNENYKVKIREGITYISYFNKGAKSEECRFYNNDDQMIAGPLDVKSKQWSSWIKINELSIGQSCVPK